MPEIATAAEADRLYRNILVPSDGSEGARRGLRYGLDLAGKYHATVHVLQVIDEATYGETPALSSDELVLEKHEERADAVLADVLVDTDAPDVDVVVRCVRGDPRIEITRYADRHDVDLIVMGVHGGSRGGRPHVGGTTDRVLRTASVPVMPV